MDGGVGGSSEVGCQNRDSLVPRSPTSSHNQTAVEKGRAVAEQQLRTLPRTLNPAPPIPAASPWRRAAKCGCARVTERGLRGGGVLVPVACRPFQTWSAESFWFLPPLPLSLSLSRPRSSHPSSLCPPPRVRAIFRNWRTKVRGPGAQYMTRRPTTPRFPCPMWLRGRAGAAHYGPESS